MFAVLMLVSIPVILLTYIFIKLAPNPWIGALVLPLYVLVFAVIIAAFGG